MKLLSLIKGLRRECALIRLTTSSLGIMSYVIYMGSMGTPHSERCTTDIDFANIEALGSR